MLDTASGGEQAVDMVKNAFQKKQFSYGLIFMDISMPILNGFDATDMIRSFLRRKNMYQPMIIACTGHTEDEYLQKAWAHQIDEVI